MIVRTQTPASNRPALPAKPRPTLHRRAMCQFIALALFGGGAAHAATPQAAFSSGWLAGKQAGATRQVASGTTGGQAGNGGNVFTPGNVMLQQRVQQSIVNLDAAAQAVAAQMSAQKSAQAAAQALASNVPDGLGAGGLRVDSRVGADPSLWQNANAPTQSVAGGKTTVDIKQTKSKAIMTWESFNVGRNTTVHFDQTGGNQTGGSNQWIALNRINDPSGKPSEILGQIKAEGTVYLLNRNGMIFGGGAQVDTHSLIASSLDLFTNDVAKSNAFFMKYGIGATQDPEHLLPRDDVTFLTSGADEGYAESARGAVVVEKGASISGTKDGFVILSGPTVSQAGQVVADDAQVILSAAPGLVALQNIAGNLNVAASGRNPGIARPEGVVENTGLIQARRGSIHWLADDAHQDGVVVASTSLSHPGSLTFDLVRGTDGGRITFGTGSVTTVLPEKDGETTSSSQDADKAFKTSSVNVNADAVMESGALMEVPAGNVTFGADAYMAGGSVIDVSGLANVTLPMSALLVIIPRIGLNELADSPLLRNSSLYTAKNVAIDSTQSGTRADGVEWVGSPVLNAAGYVANMPRTVDQLMINAGTASFKGSAVIRTGAQIRLEGGFLNYLPGYIQAPRLQGSNGLLYDIASADPNVDYAGFAGIYTRDHARWGVSETFTTSPLLANTGRFDPGFIKGGDAGTVSFEALPSQSIVIDGDLSAHAYAGREQVRTGVLPLAGTLSIIAVDQSIASPEFFLKPSDAINYVIQHDAAPVESYVPDFDEDSTLPPRGGNPDDPSNPLWWRPLSTAMIESGGFRKLRLETNGTVLVRDDANLQLADGGEVDITAGAVNVQGKVTTHGGTIDLVSVPTGANEPSTDYVQAFLRVGSHGVLDTSGRWINDAGRAADAVEGDSWIDGGNVSLTAWQGLVALSKKDDTANIYLDSGSVIDVSGGGYVSTEGKLAMNGALPEGRGGDVSLETHVKSGRFDYAAPGISAPADLSGGAIELNGSLVAEGFSGGGSLTLHASMIRIGGPATSDEGQGLLYLDPTFFASLGFTSYNLVADTDASVAPGVSVVVNPRYMLADQQGLLTLPSTTSLLGTAGRAVETTVGDVGAYQRYAHRPDGSGIRIEAGIYQSWGVLPDSPTYAAVTGAIDIGKGARVEVGSGETVELSSAGHVVVDGSLVARGGRIDLENIGYAVGFNGKPVANRSLWLGDEAILDAGGVTLLDPTAVALPGSGTSVSQRRTGVVLDGGNVELVSDRDLVAEQGAQISIDGANDVFDLPFDGRRAGIDTVSYLPSPVWSDAGELTLQAGTGLYFDGSVKAHGGADQARGGRLAIGAHTALDRNLGVQQLIFSQSGWRVPDGGDPYGAVLGQGDNADLRFSADRLAGSGIEDLTVGGIGTDVVFAGDVELDLGRSIQIDTQHVASIGAGDRKAVFTGQGTPGGHVVLSAPYVSIVGTDSNTAPGSATGNSSLEVTADFIDIGGHVNLSGFGDASFKSTGDLRFWISGDQPLFTQPGWLFTSGNLDFTATRVYPTTGYRFLIDASNPANETTIAFHQADATDTSTPLSAGGTLAVGADHIVQEGTLWVPSGAIALGTDDPAATLSAWGLAASMPLTATKDVHLAPGSVTSVSLEGAVVPYGTTEDGKDWHYDVQTASAPTIVDAPPGKSLSIAGDNVSIDPGAKLDLSGGGHLQAVEWVPGTGGSRDVLAQYHTDYSDSQAGVQVPQYADGRPVYAIVPGYRAPLSAHDAALEKGAGAGPDVGQGVYLSGVPGLPDGVYTLLPARYATLPGAYRIVQDTGITDAVVGRVATAPDGTQVVGGYFADTLTGARNARASTFMLQSAQTWGQYSEYDITSADTFFADKVARNGGAAPRLGADAGRLTIAASKALSLGATLDAAPAAGGRGSQVDIAGDAIQILGAAEPALDGYLHVSADELSQLGAGSLLIGGKRDSTAQGDAVDVIASRVLLSNDATHPLQGSEIILAANGDGGVTLGDGSVLRATATTDAPSAPLLIGQDASDTHPAISGDGALLRVSGLAPSAIVRNDITGLDGAAGTPGGDLTIGAGAVIDAARSLSMDATGHAQLAADATLQAKAIDVTAARIALGDSAADAQESAGTLLVGPRVLAQLSSSESTTLRGRQSIDLLGDASLAVANDLVLSTPTLTSDGGRASLSAGSLTIGNDTGATSIGPAPGDGVLDVETSAFHLGDGNVASRGLGHFDVEASAGMSASGTGTLDLAGADVAIATPRVSADNGADSQLVTTGAMQLLGGGQVEESNATVAGGKLGLEAGSLVVATALSSPGGKFQLHATSGDVSIEDGASIDVSGLSLPFNDTVVHVPGGTVQLSADHGNITLAQDATVDVSGAVDGGNSGTLAVEATAGTASLPGRLLGEAADGYLGGVLAIDTFAAFDLSALSARAAAGGFDGSLSVHTRQGDLTLAAGDTLHAHLVHLTADGGDVGIAGTIDASGTFGGTIGLFGAHGVDIDGRLDTSASTAGHHGGDITLGTSGVADGSLNATYGYENVQAADAGHIRLGSNAVLVQDGDLGAGKLYLRAPLLADGDVPVRLEPGLDLSHTSSTTLEAFAVWDTKDNSADPAKHFDGIVDAAGWFQADPVTGRPVLVAGTFTDDAGNAVADPDRSEDAQVMDYLSRYRFTPGAVNAAHATYYGYANGDEAQGAGTLMGFVQQPGFAFESRFAGVPNLDTRPGIELRNSSTTVNDGDISIVTNWNLGAGTRDADGTLHQVFRYGPRMESPVLTFRASHDVDIRASVTDGFYQVGNAGGSGGGAAPVPTTYEEASAGWQQLLDTGLGVDGFPDLFSPPTEFTSGDATAINDYYTEYVAYSKYLMSDLGTAAPGYRPVDVTTYGLGFGFIMDVDGEPAPLARPTNLNEYVPYLAKYPDYLKQSIALTGFADSLSVPDTFATLAAPPTTLDAIDRSAPVDNSPSPIATAKNPLPLLSATLAGGNSSSYRFVAGADALSADPLALAGGSTGDVTLGGHTEFADTTNRVIVAPTLVRTGTGDIDMVSAGDIRWTDDRAPAAVYAAGAPADGTAADTSVAILQPSKFDPLSESATPELVVTGGVNPDHGGHVSLSAAGDILGLQNTVDATGDLTGTPGTPTAQYWWQWMQTGNTEARSSINFGAFDQGIMSVGGDVSITAGGDIREVSASLPTTWMISTDASGGRTLQTIGGGNLSVNAGGSILSGSYFVAKGNGTIHADGRIGSDFSVSYLTPAREQATMPVSTLIAMQDARVDVDAGDSISLGGVFNPSWLDDAGVNTLSPTGHADGQSYSTTSRLNVTAFAGDLTYGDLVSPLGLFTPGLSADAFSESAGDILPATVNLAATNGNLDLMAAGELFPSSDGNLSLLARDSIHFDMQAGGAVASRFVWGLIDAPLESMASPLFLDPLTAPSSVPAANARQRGYLADSLFGDLPEQQFLHAAIPWHAGDNDPVRVYALDGDIVNGTGGGMGGAYLMPSKVARIEAGRDIVDLAYVGQQVHGSDISVIRAGRDIYDTPLSVRFLRTGGVEEPWSILPVILQGGSGYLSVEAGRDLGRFASQTEFYSLPNPNTSFQTYKTVLQPGTSSFMTGIDSIGNTLNPFLGPDGASIDAAFGVGSGIDQAAFIAAYVNPAASKPAGLDDGSASLVAFVEGYDAGLGLDTGLAADAVKPSYTVDQAWARFQQLPDDAKALFTRDSLFRILAQVGKDYNDDASPFKGQYARGYAAINTLFPASLGYTANGLGGGSNGAQARVSTGDLDIRGSTIQTQRGGDVSILGPGGDALLGGTSAPPPSTDSAGNLLDGPNTQGVLTLRQGGISMFTDGSTLLAQSRVFTEQGGDVTIWSSNGDINAGKGAKTTSEIPPVSYLCTTDAWCFQNPAGQVSGAGIATLQTVAGAPEGAVYLMAPRGTVDAGDAGIRVSGNLVIAAAHVANADNVQVKGDAVGLPVVQSVNVGALNAASSAASAATKAAEDVARQQQSDARDRLPSVISVQVIGNDSSASIAPQGQGYDSSSPVQVVRGAGRAGDGLTGAERSKMQ